MFATLTVQLIALVLLAVLLAGATWVWRRANRNPFFLPLGRRSQGTGKLRIACGVLGVIVLLAVGRSTVLMIDMTYARAQAHVNPAVRAPALPPPALPAVSDTLPQHLDKARLLVTVAVLDAQVPDLKPVAVAQAELDWPTRKSTVLPLKFFGLHCNYDIQVTGVQIGFPEPLPGQPKQTREPVLVVDRSETVVWGGAGGAWDSSSRSGAIEAGRQSLSSGPEFEGYSLISSHRDNALSLTRVPSQHYVTTLVFNVLREDDPLRSMPLQAFLPPLSEYSQYNLRSAWSDPRILYTRGYWKEHMLGGLGLAERLGFPALLLIVAAVLLAQVFRRRDLAIAGMLLAIVLFVAAWDRGMLAYDLARANDRTAPLGVRLVGCCRAAQTFFYGRTAVAGLKQAADGPDAPAALRKCADVSQMALGAH